MDKRCIPVAVVPETAGGSHQLLDLSRCQMLARALLLVRLGAGWSNFPNFGGWCGASGGA